MKRFTFSLAITVLTLCSSAYGDGFGGPAFRPFSALPRMQLIKAQETQETQETQQNDQSDDKAPAPEALEGPNGNSPAPQSLDGYPFTNRCGCQASPCCADAWSGYTRPCYLEKLHGMFHRNQSGCDSCAAGKPCGHRHRAGGLAVGSMGCCGFGGGCFNSFAGGSLCGGTSGYAHGGHLGLRRWGGFGLLDSSCGCGADQGYSGNIEKGQAEKGAAPEASLPQADQEIPIPTPADEKSAYRPMFQRNVGFWPTAAQY